MDNPIPFPEPYDNGSLLAPIVLTTCNSCFSYEDGEHEECTACGSTDVYVVKEEI